MFGEKLKEYRRRKGWNQEDLARESGYSRSSIINWETGKRAPRTVDIEHLALTLGVSTCDLLGGYFDARNEEEQIKLQTIGAETPKVGYAYWGGVLDAAKKVAREKDMEEISLILPILKVAYNTLISVWDKEQEQEVAGTESPSISAYNGDHSSYTGNSLTVEALA